MCDKVMHILLVDDEPLFTNIMGTALQKEKCRISTINRSYEVLPFLEKTPVDLIVLDIMMPDISGHDICRAIRQDPSMQDIFIIFATAKTGADDLLKGFECGANDYIAKPFRVPEVMARVRAGLRVCQLQKELKQTNLELKHAMDENALIIGTAAHDVRSPLSIIINYLSLLGDEDIMPLERIKEICLQRSYHIVNVMDDFMNLTRLNSGKIVCYNEDVDVVPIVVSGLLEYTPIAKKKNITMTYQIPDGEANVFLDAERFQTIVMNLYSNAVKFTPEGGSVSAQVEMDEKSVRVIFSDTGIGISSEHMEQIFQPFSKTSRGKPSQFDTTHTGMGLAISRRLAEKMGGSLHAESDGEACGSRFVLTFPRHYDEAF